MKETSLVGYEGNVATIRPVSGRILLTYCGEEVVGEDWVGAGEVVWPPGLGVLVVVCCCAGGATVNSWGIAIIKMKVVTAKAIERPMVMRSRFFSIMDVPENDDGKPPPKTFDSPAPLPEWSKIARTRPTQTTTWTTMTKIITGPSYRSLQRPMIDAGAGQVKKTPGQGAL